MINARSETVLEQNMFRESVLHRRCVVPAKTFYEWDVDKTKVTYYMEKCPTLYLAGFYDLSYNSERFVILTTEASPYYAPIHDRMPLIIGEGDLQKWIYDDAYLHIALASVPPYLETYWEYKQQNLFPI